MVGKGNPNRNQDSDPPKGCLYWILSTLLILGLMLGIGTAIVVIVTQGFDTFSVVGRTISVLGIVFISLTIFWPTWLFHGFRAPELPDHVGVTIWARILGTVFGLGFFFGGLALVGTSDVKYLLLAFAATMIAANVFRWILSRAPHD